MSGLFGGGGGSSYVPPQPQTDVEQEQANAKKAAADRQRREESRTRKNQYGSAVQFRPDNVLAGAGGDTTLASGSLLSLGGPLG